MTAPDSADRWTFCSLGHVHGGAWTQVHITHVGNQRPGVGLQEADKRG
jgi:hypothetical protein